jgi:hypothetical protein
MFVTKKGILLHNLSFCSCRYSESLLLCRDGSERKLEKFDVIVELLKDRLLTPGLPLVTDKG